jgi:hypothetical protein
MMFLRIALREASDMIASRNAIMLLAVLLTLDGVFILAHIFHVFVSDVAMFRDPRFFMERDRGYGEWYEYFKSGLCILALVGCYRSSAQPVYAGLSFVNGLILADNALRLHERLGKELSHLLTATKQYFEDAPQAFGELASFGILGLVSAVILVATFRRSELVHQARGALLLFLMIALAGFSVGVDLWHASVRDDPWLDRVFGTIEDGGETVILSMCCAVAGMLFLRTP